MSFTSEEIIDYERLIEMEDNKIFLGKAQIESMRCSLSLMKLIHSFEQGSAPEILEKNIFSDISKDEIKSRLDVSDDTITRVRVKDGEYPVFMEEEIIKKLDQNLAMEIAKEFDAESFLKVTLPEGLAYVCNDETILRNRLSQYFQLISHKDGWFESLCNRCGSDSITIEKAKEVAKTVWREILLTLKENTGLWRQLIEIVDSETTKMDSEERDLIARRDVCSEEISRLNLGAEQIRRTLHRVHPKRRGVLEERISEMRKRGDILREEVKSIDEKLDRR